EFRAEPHCGNSARHYLDLGSAEVCVLATSIKDTVKILFLHAIGIDDYETADSEASELFYHGASCSGASYDRNRQRPQAANCACAEQLQVTLREQRKVWAVLGNPKLQVVTGNQD